MLETFRNPPLVSAAAGMTYLKEGMGVAFLALELETFRKAPKISDRKLLTVQNAKRFLINRVVLVKTL